MEQANCVIFRACSWLAGRAGALIIGLALVWVLTPMPMWSQWNGTNPVWTNSNVGIGTANPGSALQVEGLTTFHRDDWGNHTLILRGQKAGAPYNWGEYAIIACWVGLIFGNTQTGTTLLQLGDTNVLIAPSAGNVGIGTTAPQYKLAVNGTIGAKDVIVTNTGWPDYVFRPGYRLRPLSEVGAYIRAHHRLPDVPSEAEVKEKGVSVSEIQAKLLAKIEELTLHMIQQDKDNRELREHISRQEKENGELRERVGRLETLAAGSAPAAGR